MEAVDKLIFAAVALALGSLLIFYAPVLHKLGYICLGAFLIVTPLPVFITWWLVPKIYPAMQICQSCDFIAKAGEIPRGE